MDISDFKFQLVCKLINNTFNNFRCHPQLYFKNFKNLQVFAGCKDDVFIELSLKSVSSASSGNLLD